MVPLGWVYRIAICIQMVSALQSRRRKNAPLECDVRLMADCASVVPREAFHDIPRCCSSKSYFAKRGQDYVVLFPPASPIKCSHITRGRCSAISPFLMLPSLSVSVSSLSLAAVVVFDCGYCPESASIFAHAIPIGTLTRVGWSMLPIFGYFAWRPCLSNLRTICFRSFGTYSDFDTLGSRSPSSIIASSSELRRHMHRVLPD